MDAPRVLIVGASTRSAAWSALRAGWRPVCLDMFADLDLQRFAEVIPLADYPRDVPAAAAQLPAMPWFYTGALENQPRLVSELSQRHSLWGNGPAVLRLVRQPAWMCEQLRLAGCPALPVRLSKNPPTPDGRWMLKPRRGAAGRGITIWDETAATSPTLREPHFFQARAVGESISALYLARPDTTELIGISTQLIGEPAFHAPDFAYCGSITPPDTVSDDVEKTMRRAGEQIARAAGLRGLFGIDFILAEDGFPYATEINPRYTASVELFEHALGIPLLERHRRACLAEPDVSPSPGNRGETSRYLGKAVLYAGRDFIVGESARQVPAQLPWPDLPQVADIPPAGTPMRRGIPVCTVFAAGATWLECRTRLADEAAAVARRLETR